MIQSRLVSKFIFGSLLVAWSHAYADSSATNASATHSSIIDLLEITPSAQSVDYVNNKKQFQLHSLITEQRHPKTYNLSYQISQNTTAGLNSLLAVDKDITNKFNQMSGDPEQLKILDQASQAVQNAILNGHKIYFYGTGSTGRLAEAVESVLWRPFWEKVAQTPEWNKLKDRLPNIQNRLKGEITGADRALISSLEGFEDLQIIGKLQLADNKIQKDDVVFGITEGGETSAVIGTVLAAASMYDNQPTHNLYFVFNNPEQVLRPFDRSRSVLDNPLITKINVTTGPQALSGSTRMQAVTSSLYLSGIILEDAIYHVLQRYLSKSELEQLGFNQSMTIQNQLRKFASIQSTIYNSGAKITPWTDLEAKTYATQHHVTYFAQKALLPVFIDVTERSPTFRISPLDQVNAKEKKSWIRVWSPAEDKQQAWNMLLHRPFHGLNPQLYQDQFNHIEDPYLKEAALTSLADAGEKEKNLYDLSFSKENIENNGPMAGDLGVMILLSNENLTSRFWEWLKLFADAKASLVLVSIAQTPLPESQIKDFKKLKTTTNYLQIIIPHDDPFGLSQMIGLKMLLNANSTGVMAKLDRFVGNTMTDVQPSNLKLIGRATYLIENHVNGVLSSQAWIKSYGKTPPITFAQANAVLFDAMNYVNNAGLVNKFSEVPLAIVRILESLKQHKNISWQQAQAILEQQKLGQYLSGYEK